MVEIKIDNTGDGTWWLYNSNQGWKDYCGEECPHRGAYRRVPKIDGGLGLCPNLKGE